jgi:hypothetical protein
MTEPKPNSQSNQNHAVCKRTVVLLAGFDPRGASYYHKMLSTQIKKYGDREKIAVSLSTRKRLKDHLHRWNIATEACSISFFYAEWDDLVRQHWQRSRLQLFFDSCRAYRKYLGSLRFLKGSSSTSYSQIGFYYPLISFLLLYSTLTVVMGLVAWTLGKLFQLSSLGMSAGILAAVVGAIFLAHRISPRLNGGWLLRIYCFTKRAACEGMPDWAARTPVVTRSLVNQLRDDPPDELLVVGHSVGTIMAVPLLKELLENTGYTGRVSYMALGQCVQLVSFLQNEDGDFNRTLLEVALNPRLDWVDFTMPSDGACVALQDPLRAAFDNPPEYPRSDSPKFLSARLMEGYTPERFKELKRDPFHYHFSYYMTPDKAAEFEFAAVILGDQPLALRFANRKNQARNKPA